MTNKHASLDALFTDIADAIREKTGDTATIIADDFPDVIRERFRVISPPATPPYLTFSSPSSFTLKVNDTTKHWDGTLEYSTDASTWSNWDGATTLSSATSGSDNVLYLRGTGNTKITGNSTDYRWVITGTDISCIGSIENLLDYATVQSGAHPTMATYCYRSMFHGCTGLTQAPELPATTLENYCYINMFYNCTGLTQAPALPATTLKTSCYQSMFYGCTKIKLSSTQTGEYTVAYRIPTTGTGTTATDALRDMFSSTGGTFTGTPAINTTYYLSNTVDPIVVNITASNISEYFTVNNSSSYYFNGQGNVFTTNNKGISSSTASTILTAKQDISEISFDYSYSSERPYDKFTLKVAGSFIENGVSGPTTAKSYNGPLTSGQTIEFKYIKDSSVDKNDDKCTFSNMVIKLG